MKLPSVPELLNFWESSLNHTLLQKAVELLHLAYPDKTIEEVAGLSIGERDTKLLLLRERLFGRLMQNMAVCPECSAKNEWETNTSELLTGSPEPPASRLTYTLKEKGYSISFRLPDSRDLAGIPFQDTKDSQAGKLLVKLISDCKFKNKTLKIQDLPAEIMDAIENQIELKSRQSDIQMSVRCVNCHYQWEIQFDIVSYLWNEIDNWARHILQDVVILAQAFGWSEQDILNLSPVRRKIYLDLTAS
jgi:hypothetical protein